MKYVIYENHVNKHIKIHKEGCRQLKKNGGTGIGLYKEFYTLEDAENYAKQHMDEDKIGRCFFCFN